MFKFVVVCALIGVAVAEPQALISSYGGLVSSPEYYPSAYSNLVYNSPLVQSAAISYSSPLAHLIKKRSASLIWPSTYSAISPLTTSYTAYSPLATTYSSPIITTAHLIKKRSAVWPSIYSAISPLATSLYTPTIGAASYISPYYSSLPLAYGASLIKK